MVVQYILGRSGITVPYCTWIGESVEVWGNLVEARYSGMEVSDETDKGIDDPRAYLYATPITAEQRDLSSSTVLFQWRMRLQHAPELALLCRFPRCAQICPPAVCTPVRPITNLHTRVQRTYWT